MAQAQRYKLKLSKLQFCSLVDEPAQPNAKTLLIKRKGTSDDIAATARLKKVNDELGLAFFWAFTSTNADGSDHYDLQGDHVTEFIKAAMDYMTETGGAVDVMHDGIAGEDRVVFAMPMDPEIAAAYGMVTKQTGLMVVVKPTEENLAKLKSGELNGVSIGGLGERVPVGKAQPSFAVGDHVECLVNHMPGMKGMTGIIAIAREGTPPYYGVKFDDQDAMPGVHKWLAQDEIKAAPSDAGTSMPGMKRAPLIRKEAVLTSTDAGHAHTVSLDDPARYWCDQLQTSYQTAEGADYGHSHAWVFDAKTGAITVADDSGHSHTIEAVVPSDVLALYTVREAQRDAANLADAASDGAPSQEISDEESRSAPTVVVVTARAPHSKSTRSGSASESGLNTKEPIMANENDAKIADLTKRNERLERLAKLNGAHKAHFDSLTGDAQDEFLAKSAADRDAVIADVVKRAEEAEKVVYTSTSTGVVYKAKDDPRLIDMAKRLDEQAQAIEKADVRKAALEVLGGMPGDDETHDFIIASLRKGGDPVKAQKALEALKGMKATSTIGKAAPGFGGSQTELAGDVDATMAALEKGLVAFCKAQNITKNLWTDGLAAFVQTDEGKALKKAHDESLAG